MNALKAIYLKEITGYFYSPIAYVLLTGFLLLTGYFFYTSVSLYSVLSMQAMQNPNLAGLNIQDYVVAPLLGNMSVILMLITPLITMRLLSEEKKNGTLELLLSYPISDTTVVMAKFLAALSILGIAMILSCLPFVMLGVLGKLHVLSLLSGYLGLFFVAACFASFGLFTSCATENQIVAAVTAFAGLLLFWILGWTEQTVGPLVGEVLKNISLGNHLENFLKGVIDTADVMYFLVFICLFLFVSIRILEAKRWKN